MKNKLLKTMFLVAVVVPMFVSVFAVSYSDLLARLDIIAQDISSMKEQYNEILTTYPDVIDSLSDKTKSAVKTLADNLMNDEIVNTVKDLKAELAASAVPNADKVLEAVESLQADATKLIDDNKDIVEEVKSGYTDLSVNEIKQVVEKVTDIVESLGTNVDVTDTYNEMLQIITDAHTIANQMADKLEVTIASNVKTFEAALTKSLVKELLTEVKNKDVEAIIDTLTVAVNNVEGGAKLKEELKEIKTMALNLKDKIMEVEALDEQELLMFTDVQKKAVADKIKDVEKDFIDFVKAVINNSAVDYMDVVINLVYNEPIDNMIEHANTALDYFNQYKDTIKDLSVSKLASKLPANIKEIAKKAGLMVALGFVDTSDYNKSYITNNFQQEINKMKEYVSNEIVEYMDHIQLTMKNELKGIGKKDISLSEMQNEYRSLTGSKLTTLTNFKALKNRVDEELLANQEEIKNKLDSYVNLVYRMFNSTITESIVNTLETENEKQATEKAYEYDYRNEYIVTNKFISTSIFTQELGVPEQHKDIVSYSNITSDKVKTGSELMVEVSSSDFVYAMFAVLGDVYADGGIDARDYMVIKNHIMVDEEISDICSIAADTYRDGGIDARDYMVIKNYIMNNVEISL